MSLNTYLLHKYLSNNIFYDENYLNNFILLSLFIEKRITFDAKYQNKFFFLNTVTINLIKMYKN